MEPRLLAQAVLGLVVPYLRGDDREPLVAELWADVRPQLLVATSQTLLDRLPDSRAAQAEAERALEMLMLINEDFAGRIEELLDRIQGRRGRGRLSAPPAPPASVASPPPSPAPPPPPQQPPAYGWPGGYGLGGGDSAPDGGQMPGGTAARSGSRAGWLGRLGRGVGRPGGPELLRDTTGRAWPAQPSRRRRRPGAADVPPQGAGRTIPTASRLVSTGVAVADGALRSLTPRTVLGADRPYLYWFSVGMPRANRVDTGPHQPLPIIQAVPGLQLTVIVFPFAGGLVLDPRADTGVLVFDDAGYLRVQRQPGNGYSRSADDDRLLFPIRTPAEPGTYRLRSSVYLGARLLQSRVLEVRVGRRQRLAVRPAMRSSTDYSVTDELTSEALRDMRPPRVSILVNDGPDGSHDFRFVGSAGATHGTASVDAETAERMLERARRSLRTAAWGKPTEWTEDDGYRYGEPRSVEDVQADLISMAKSGFRLWDTLASALAEAVADQLPESDDLDREFTELLLPSGSVEFACRQALRLAVPSALLYDYPLDTSKPARFCDAAAAALWGSDRDLTRVPCFIGHCPHYLDDDVVCPSGFWGFRHEIGVPVSLTGGRKKDATALAAQIRGADDPVVVVGSTTDKAFARRLDHLGRLQQLHVPIDWQLGEERDAVLALLKNSQPHVVYFLCHGVETEDGLPGLIVGDPDHPVAITPDNLRNAGVRWPTTRPLVILNGCRTTALDPTKPWNFVEPFLKRAHASGVIGTEITIFEPLACDFAEEVLERFVGRDMTLGRAVRETRLALLRRRNPLGLAYVPYAPVELRMV